MNSLHKTTSALPLCAVHQAAQHAASRCTGKFAVRTFSTLRSVKLLALGLGLAVVTLSGARAVNTELDVLNGQTDLSLAGTYTQGTASTTTNDVNFTAGTAYNPAAFTVGTGISIGTLDDLSTTALMVSNTGGAAAATITLNGGGDSVTGSNAADLFYVATGGSLTLTGGTGATALNLALGAAGNFDIVGAANISSVISDTGSGFTKTGAGTLTLSGANTYTGGTALNVGTILVGSNTALGTGTITLGGGTLIQTGVTRTLTNAIVVGAAGGTFGGTGATLATDLTLNGNITGSGPLTLAGIFNNSGVNLGGDSSGYTGTVTVNGANNRFNTTTAGSAAAAFVVNGNLETNVVGGGTFNLGALSGGTAGGISGHAANTATAVSTLSVGALNTSTTYGGIIVNNAAATAATGNSDTAANNVLALTKVGTGTLTLTSVTSSFTGDVTINGGVIAVNGALGNTPTASGLGALQPAANRNFMVNNGGTLAFTAGNVLGTGGSTNTLANNTLVVNAGGIFTTGSATATGGFWNKIGATTLNGGTINVGSGANTTNFQGLALIGNVTVGGTSTMPSAIQNITGSLATSNAVHLGQNATAGQVITFNVADVTGNATSDLNISTPLINTSSTLTASGLTKTGLGTMTLSGANAYTGPTMVSTGILSLGTTAAMTGATGTVTAGGGTLTSTVANANLGGSLVMNIAGSNISPNGAAVGTLTLASTRTLTVSAGTLSLNIASTTSFDQIAGSGTGSAFTITGGTLDLGLGTANSAMYASTYQLLSGFAAGSVSGLAITNYDTTDYIASLSNAGLLSFAAVPEPSTWVAVVFGMLGLCAFGQRRRSGAALRS